MTEDLDYDERARQGVAAAVAFLDEHAPEGWRERVNIGEINMMSWRWCVLGQIYEGSQSARGDFGAYGWADDHLSELDPDNYREVRPAFASYRDEWKRQLGGVA